MPALDCSAKEEEEELRLKLYQTTLMCVELTILWHMGCLLAQVSQVVVVME
jgi:hypothetical protein